MAERKPVKSAAKKAPARPPAKKPGKSIVNQKQTPWGLIITTIVIVAFAIGVIGYAVSNRKTTHKLTEAGADVTRCTQMIGTNSPSYLNELQCAKDIQGVTFKQEPNHSHVSGTVKYDATPPVGGNHNQFWANCTGTVYAEPLADENAVHMLEHGAIWITYNPNLPTDQVNVLSKLVSGNDHMALSPYPTLKSPISLQAWGYQLFVDNASDARIKKFINVLQWNPKTTPEYGASCSDQYFDPALSTPGHPQESPKA